MPNGKPSRLIKVILTRLGKLETSGVGATDLDALTDVTLSSPSEAQALMYDSGAGYWKNSALPPGGGGAVNSVFGRTGAVTAEATDYSMFFAPTAGAAGVASFNTRTGAVTSQATDYSPYFAPTGVTTFNTRSGAVTPAAADYSAYFAPTGVTSFNSRTGAVTPSSSDYSAYFAPTSAGSQYFAPTATNITNTLSSGTPMFFNATATAADHWIAASAVVANICFGTGSAPTASTTNEGSLWIKYTA